MSGNLSEKILVIKNLEKKFGGYKVIDGLNAFLYSKTITSLIGPNGAGKTTLFNIINGFIEPDSGEIFYKGKSIVGLKPYKIAYMGVGRLFQDIRIFQHLTVFENVILGSKDFVGKYPWEVILRYKRVKDNWRLLKEKAERWIEFVGLADKMNVYAESLSYGQQKLVAIARLLMQEADLLLLDEPTAGVNPKMISKILDVICQLVEKEGKSIFLIEHNMSVVMEISDFVYFMHQGKIVAFGSWDDIKSREDVKKIYLGL